MSLTYNRFKSTTIYGNFVNSDYPDNTILANGKFDRDLTVKGNLYLGNEITNRDASGNIISYTDTNGNIRYYLNGVLYTITPSQLSQLNNTLASQSWVSSLITQKISDLIGGAPSSLDTLKEIADAINNDSAIYNTLLNNIATKGSLSANNIWTGTQTFNNNITFSTSINGISNATFSYISGLTSSAQTQLNNLNTSITNYQPLLLYDTIPIINSTKLINSGNLYNTFQNYATQSQITTANTNITNLQSNKADLTYVNTQIGNINSNNTSINTAYGMDTTNKNINANIYNNGLKVNSDGSFVALINKNLTNSTGGDFALYQGVNGDTVLNSSINQSLQFKINNNEKMRVDSTGNVNINNNLNIGSILTTNGTANFNGASNFIGSAYFNNPVNFYNQVISNSTNNIIRFSGQVGAILLDGGPLTYQKYYISYSESRFYGYSTIDALILNPGYGCRMYPFGAYANVNTDTYDNFIGVSPLFFNAIQVNAYVGIKLYYLNWNNEITLSPISQRT